MPKKTKKAKLIAEYRRKLQRLDGTPISAPSQVHHDVFTLPVVSAEIPKPSIVEIPEDEARAIKNDLMKTVGIVSLFLIFEFFLARILQ